MGKFIGWDVHVIPASKCTNCGMDKEQKKGCCNDKQATFTIAKEQLASIITDVPGNYFACIQYEYISFINPSIGAEDAPVQSIHAPPLILITSPFILYCVFRI